jgi:hypothetical protein
MYSPLGAVVDLIYCYYYLMHPVLPIEFPVNLGRSVGRYGLESTSNVLSVLHIASGAALSVRCVFRHLMVTCGSGYKDFLRYTVCGSSKSVGTTGGQVGVRYCQQQH